MSDANPTKAAAPSTSVSSVLAAHAAAQISAAHNADQAASTPQIASAKPAGAHCVSFTTSWANVAMCIGFKKPKPS